MFCVLFFLYNFLTPAETVRVVTPTIYVGGTYVSWWRRGQKSHKAWREIKRKKVCTFCMWLVIDVRLANLICNDISHVRL